ncbi:hypothetical protein DAI18_07885 [Microvirgula aerodenitrificans]|uniref:HTH-like domain-containing protein n=1 Tax=Microvirgula aerodenitrificans TaxID=57480 RepID=A0A2S0P9F8_9NEIS|nr:hypothetical protein DAI18_07885 [Microvirgula aerodenitrificans]
MPRTIRGARSSADLGSPNSAGCGSCERRACSLIQLNRKTYRYRPGSDRNGPLRQRIREIAEVRVRYGYRRIQVLLRLEGWQVNHKRTHRLYGTEPAQLATSA